jgi:hypothetical protein
MIAHAGPDVLRRSASGEEHSRSRIVARYQLGKLEDFWKSEMSGIRVGTVRYENAPALAGTISRCTDERRQADPSAMNLYYMNTMVDNNRPAITCNATTVIMGMTTAWTYSPEYQFLLAHEVGHALSLGHVSDVNNVMHPSQRAPHFTFGQIYRAHFDATGLVNALLEINTSVARNCALPNSAHCLADTVRLASGGVSARR